MRALQTMTGYAAGFLVQEHNVGPICIGHCADLLVSDGDPLADTRTQAIHAISSEAG